MTPRPLTSKASAERVGASWSATSRSAARSSRARIWRLVTNEPSRPATGEVVNVSRRDLRIRPDAGLLEPTSGNTQFGRSRDDWGNWFGGNNSNPMWHYVLKDHYLARNRHLAPPDVRNHISVEPGAAPVYPVSRTLTRFNDFSKANRFTSACSPIIYRDDFLGAAFAGNSFVCEPVHNLVHREIVSAAGATFTSQRGRRRAAVGILRFERQLVSPLDGPQRSRRRGLGGRTCIVS